MPFFCVEIQERIHVEMRGIIVESNLTGSQVQIQIDHPSVLELKNFIQIANTNYIGLDPANQFFENKHVLVRLNPGDAKYVDAMHTNTGTLLTGSFGIYMPVG